MTDYPLVNGKQMNKSQKFLWDMILFCEAKGERWSIKSLGCPGSSLRLLTAMDKLRDAGLINVGGEDRMHVLYSIHPQQSANIVHSFKPRNKTEAEIWNALVTGQEVFVSRDNRHSQRRRNSISRIRASKVELERTDKPWHSQYSFRLPALTNGDCTTNRILADPNTVNHQDPI